MVSELNRETRRVREYYVACDFTYTTVRCADGRCFPAKPKPPCFGGGCFTEDPVTLEWTLLTEASVSHTTDEPSPTNDAEATAKAR